MSRVTSRGAAVVAIWALLNATLAAVLFVFDARDAVMERTFYFSAVAVLLAAATVVLLFPRRRKDPARLAAGGQAAPAFAAACLIGGLAWVFGIYMAYFALPLLALVAGRLWSDRREREVR